MYCVMYDIRSRVANGPTSWGPNPFRTRKYKPEPCPNPKTNLKPKSCPKKTKVKLGLKNLARLPSYFAYIFVHLKQKARLRPELSQNFCQLPARTRPEKPGPTYNSDLFWPTLSRTFLNRLNSNSTQHTEVQLKLFVVLRWSQVFKN